VKELRTPCKVSTVPLMKSVLLSIVCVCVMYLCLLIQLVLIGSCVFIWAYSCLTFYPTMLGVISKLEEGGGIKMYCSEIIYWL